ncbi:Uncharacterised protein [Providencia rustigianii]|nr:Uncharacterised protein [Providencia rustigianii]
MRIIGYVLLMLIQSSPVPVTEQIYTQQECESRAMQIMQVRDVEIVCGEVFSEKTINAR